MIVEGGQQPAAVTSTPQCLQKVVWTRDTECLWSCKTQNTQVGWPGSSFPEIVSFLSSFLVISSVKPTG